MNIISGQNVDLISPFPIGEVHRVFGWNHCYRTLTENDDTPNTMNEFTEHMKRIIAQYPTWGIIDKNHITNVNHEAPLVGIGMFEPATIRHGFFHVATARKAFKTGLIDEAAQLVIKYLFDNIPTLLRVGGYMDEKNAPAKSLCKRLGFKFEGLVEDMIIREGIPRNVVYFGLTKRAWQAQENKEQCLSQELQVPQQDPKMSEVPTQVTISSVS